MANCNDLPLSMTSILTRRSVLKLLLGFSAAFTLGRLPDEKMRRRMVQLAGKL